MALVIAASYNTTLVVKSALGSYLGATDYYTEWSEANLGKANLSKAETEAIKTLGKALTETYRSKQ